MYYGDETLTFLVQGFCKPDALGVTLTETTDWDCRCCHLDYCLAEFHEEVSAVGVEGSLCIELVWLTLAVVYPTLYVNIQVHSSGYTCRRQTLALMFVRPKVDRSISVTCPNQPPVFELYVIRCGSMNRYWKNMCLREIGLCVKKCVTI